MRGFKVQGSVKKSLLFFEPRRLNPEPYLNPSACISKRQARKIKVIGITSSRETRLPMRSAHLYRQRQDQQNFTGPPKHPNRSIRTLLQISLIGRSL